MAPEAMEARVAVEWRSFPQYIHCKEFRVETDMSVCLCACDEVTYMRTNKGSNTHTHTAETKIIPNIIPIEHTHTHTCRIRCCCCALPFDM